MSLGALLKTCWVSLFLILFIKYEQKEKFGAIGQIYHALAPKETKTDKLRGWQAAH